MLRKVGYTQQLNGVYSPYADVFFINPSTDLYIRAPGLMDSGADHTLIPLSVGREIGLKWESTDELKEVRGITGAMTFLEKDCTIALHNSDSTKLFLFDTRVWWAYPHKNDVDALNSLYRKSADISKALATSRKDEIKKVLTEAQNNLETEIQKLSSAYETLTCIGRNFFSNFSFIQFSDKDSPSRSKFIYRVREDKVSRIIDLEG